MSRSDRERVNKDHNMIGQVISHYKILEKLGEGGMGIVYKAQDTKLDRIVALKFLPHHLTANDAEKARFLQEAKAASSLNHPHVCTIYSLEEHEGQQYIEMEYVDGVTLRQKIPIGKLSDVIAYAIQIADALQEAHARGIVHRDIKADNIMVNAKNQIKVMDFGLAKLKGTLKLTRTSSTVGTLAYMAPEQIQGEEVDARSDIFSFGVVLFEMVTGKLPFRGEHEAAMMYSIVNEEAESVQKYKPDIAPEFIHILNRALEKDPADRYQTAQDMLIDLRRLQKQSTKVSRASMVGIPVQPVEHFSAPVTEQTAPTKQFSKTILLFVGIILLVGIAFTLYKLFIAGSFKNNEWPFTAIKITRLTTSGKAGMAAISPDGKYVVHAAVEGGEMSLWVQQVATTSNVMIVPSAKVEYLGITFSNDGNYVYYVANDTNNANGALFEIPVLGGTARKILSDLSSAVIFSPDGKQMAFIRQYHALGEEALIVTNADGSSERKLAARRGDDFFISVNGVAPSWSPDGKLIAVSVGSDVGVQHINLMGYSVVDGSERLLSTENWQHLGRIAWASDGRGLVLIGSKSGSLNNQVWYLQYPEGALRSITNDLSDYSAGSLAITANASMIVTTSVDVRSNIWVLTKSLSDRDVWDDQHALQITSGAATYDGIEGIDWTPDDKLVYTARSSGNSGLWTINRDGSNQRQLTQSRESGPSVSADGKFIAYVSFRDTTAHIWRMDIDGGNPTKLSLAEDYGPSITPDGKWVVYEGWATGKVLLYKVPLAGGDTVQLSPNPASNPELSPDGRLIVCRYYDEVKRKWGQAILTFERAVLQRFFTLPYSASTIDWYPDGKSLTYTDTHNGVSNIWSMPPEGGESKMLTHFSSGLIFGYRWSRDGQYLAIARGQVASDVVLITNNK
jgi:serine/threonine protein kinase/Tol biopolymer transport system component